MNWKKIIDEYLLKIKAFSNKSSDKKILIIPPDHTRLYSMAGDITKYLYDKLSNDYQIDIMPALGTHKPMTNEEIDLMFGDNIPKSTFIKHLWREDVIELDEISGKDMELLSEGKINYPVNISINKKLIEDSYQFIFSVGQVVPHEVIGMANYTKNILIGVGGGDSIHKSHFLGAVYGMERIMGRKVSPVRQLLDEAYKKFVSHLPIHFFLTVIERKKIKGMFCGVDEQCFNQAVEQSQKVNLTLLDKPIKKAVVYLDPREFKSTWLGNKAIYRLRMAMADDGELIILAPALETFGEDKIIDRLIRKYGYRGTENILKKVSENEELKNNLSAAAHLIHGSSEGRFKITYCPGTKMSEAEIEQVGYEYLPYREAIKKYPVLNWQDGWQKNESNNNQLEKEEIFYVSNPALGLWSLKEKFKNSAKNS